MTFNLTDEVQGQLETLISAYKNRESGKVMWFEVWVPTMADAFYVIAQVPENIPMPEMSQNELLTVEMTLTLEQYKGMDTAVEPV